MQFGLDIAQQRMPWAEVVSRAQFAESLGFDGVWGFDHFQPMYGEGPGDCFEGVTTLAALTGVTQRVRMGLLVTGMTYRHPSVFAAEAITIDHASGGRLELAYGAAWFDKEHRELGIPFPPTKERVDAFEEAVQIVRGLLTTDNFTFEGRYFRLEDASLLPRPVQQIGSHQRAGRYRGPRPGVDPAGRLALDRGRPRRGRRDGGRVGGGGIRLPRLRLARRRPGVGGAVRAAHLGALTPNLTSTSGSVSEGNHARAAQDHQRRRPRRGAGARLADVAAREVARARPEDRA
jgi:hypothetical protein